MTHHTRTVTVLWLALAASLAASWTHLASLFARHEWPGWWPVGAVMATAVDLGILAAMLAVGEMAARGEDTSGPRRTVAGLVALSCAANAAHVWAVGAATSAAEMALAVIVAGALPVLVWRLSLILDALRRPATAAGTRESAAAVASAGRATTDTRPARKAGQSAPGAASDARARVLAALQTAPSDASARELARLAGVSDGTVRRLVATGTIHKNGAGWEVGA